MKSGFRIIINNKFNVLALLLLTGLSVMSSIFISEKVITNIRARSIDYAWIYTSKGNIKIRFRHNAPKTVDNFINLTRMGFYDGTRVHRIVPNFLIEGGDPLSKFTDHKVQWGKGNPGYSFKGEIFTDDQMKRGVVAMSMTDDKSNGSQFFILSKDASWLNGLYPILADVVEGMEIVDELTKIETGPTGIPYEDISLNIALVK